MNLVINHYARCWLCHQLLLLLQWWQTSLSGLLTWIYGVIQLKLILVIDASRHRVAQNIILLSCLPFETRFLPNFLRIVKMASMPHRYHWLLLSIIRLTSLWMHLLHNLVTYNLHLSHLMLGWLIHTTWASCLGCKRWQWAFKTFYLIFQSFSTGLGVSIVTCPYRLQSCRYHMWPISWYT